MKMLIGLFAFLCTVACMNAAEGTSTNASINEPSQCEVKCENDCSSCRENCPRPPQSASCQRKCFDKRASCLTKCSEQSKIQ